MDPSTQGHPGRSDDDATDRSGTDGHARVDLGATGTALEPAPRLSEAIGVEVWLKRDDVGGLGGGGNKLRKLEFLLGSALRRGCDTVVTFGALQSNHARQTAAACARLGLDCELVLTRAVPRSTPAFDSGGNVLLDRLYGARLTLVEHDDEASARAVAELRARLELAGRKVAWFPPGGSDAIGTLGWVRGGAELGGQLDRVGPARARIVLPVSTAGTVAGLALGLRRAGRDDRILGVCVYRTASRSATVLDDLLADTAELLEAPADTAARSHGDLGVELTDEFLGGGYGIPTDGMRDAVELLARTEGIAADPVYSGKALAAVVDLARRGELGHDPEQPEPVVVVLTGGAPALFAYPEVFTASGSDAGDGADDAADDATVAGRDSGGHPGG